MIKKKRNENKEKERKRERKKERKKERTNIDREKNITKGYTHSEICPKFKI